MSVTFASFAAKCEAFGLTAAHCTDDHWQILGGALLVNFYPNTKRGPRFYVAGTTQGQYGNADRAIDATRIPPPTHLKHDVRNRDRHRRWKHAQIRGGRDKCHWCPAKLTIRTATLDHKIPLHRGWLDNANNWVLACGPCNKRRGHDMPELAARKAGQA